MAPRERESERQPERARRRVHARGLADPFLGHRRQRVVVELRHEQPEPGTREDERDREPPSRLGVWDHEDEAHDADRQQDEARADEARRAALPGALCPPGGRRRTSSATGVRSRSRSPSRCTRGPSAGRSAARSSATPRATCCSVELEAPSTNIFDRNRLGSSSVGFPSRLRLRSHHTSEPSATQPAAMIAATDSPPSCQTRMPSTTPPMPMTDRIAPPASTPRGPGVLDVARPG